MGYRIGIFGCAGTGKSTVGEALATKLDIPFYASKDITKEILERDGYDYGGGIQVEKFLAAGGRQIEIMERTLEVQEADKDWITDRTLLDLASYAVLELAYSDTKLLRKIYDRCEQNIGIYTHLFLAPWTDVTPNQNQKRTLNPWYQFQIHSMVVSLVRQWGVECHVLEEDGEKRVQEVVAFL